MENLGHSQISLTLDTYSHVLPALGTEPRRICWLGSNERARRPLAGFLEKSGEPGGNRTHNPQIKRTSVARPPVSAWCFPFEKSHASLLIRPPVSACDRPLVCQLVCQVRSLGREHPQGSGIMFGKTTRRFRPPQNGRVRTSSRARIDQHEQNHRGRSTGRDLRLGSNLW